ncbi:MAG: ABC transporter substrate-binding protein [Jatrophihabitantaceae bacterium]
MTTLTSVAAVGALTLTGCASNKEGPAAPTGSVSAVVAKDATLAAMVPAKIQAAGKLVIGVNPPYTPNEFVQNGKVVGFDVDLLDAVAKVLGLTTSYQQAEFDKIIPAVTAGTYDMGMSSFTDNKTREKTVDFVTYFSAGILWASPTGKTVDPNNACGLKVAVQTTTVEDTDEIPAKSKACVAAGKKAIDKVQFASQDNATNAVVLGQVDAMSADSPVTAYAVKQSAGKLQLAGGVSESTPYGWPIPKGSALGPALQKALQKLIDNGAYDQICKRWGVESGEITTSVINGATS